MRTAWCSAAKRADVARVRTRAFAHVDDVAWNVFSAAEGLSVVERRETGFFALINGTETEHQLCLLATL